MIEQENDIQWVQNYLSKALPEGHELIINDPFYEDECKWFRAAIEKETIKVKKCGKDCFLRRGEKAIHDEFIPAKGKRRPRHLFELSKAGNYTLCREYLPHIAAYTRLILELRYDQTSSSFSLYRKFSKDLLFKKKDGSFETDAEFYGKDGNLYLHVEAKKTPAETEKLVKGLNKTGLLADLSTKHAKELEYVLDLKPKYIWVVGPDSIDPEKYVYSVKVEDLNAFFRPCEQLPDPS